MTLESMTIELSPAQLHVLLSALEAYTSHVGELSQEAGLNNGRTGLVPNEGHPATGLDVGKLDKLFSDAEAMTDKLLALIPANEPITPTYEDGTPVDHDSIQGFPVPVDTALHMYRQLGPLDDPDLRDVALTD